MTYPLIGNYGITPDMESKRPWPDGYIVRELSRMPSNFRCEGSIQDFLLKYDIPGISGIDILKMLSSLPCLSYFFSKKKDVAFLFSMRRHSLTNLPARNLKVLVQEGASLLQGMG